MERDVLFLERCVELLNPGGRLAIVLPHNKLASSFYSYVREWLVERVRVVAVIGLGRNTFLPHTHQKTSILFAERRTERRRQAGKERIFFGISERDGKDSQGNLVWRADPSRGLWAGLDHDLDELVHAFGEFARAEGLHWGKA